MERNKSIDVLAVSTASLTAINRRVYKDIERAGYSVVLVVPQEMTIGSNKIRADSQRESDPDIEYLPLIGSNARLNYFSNIIKLISGYNPRYIIIDNDPATVMVLQISFFAKIISSSRVFCISCENLPLTLFSNYRRKGLKGIVYALYKKFILFLTKGLICGVFVINNEGYKIFKSEGFSCVKRIPLGFDSEFFNINHQDRVDVRNDIGIKGTFVIGYFGRISYEKGVHILISALSGLLDYEWILLMDEFELYESSYSKTISQQISNGISDRVIFTNPSHSNISRFMNAVDVVVMPSITTSIWVEQYGRVAPEAMACGKLVLASNVGAIPMLIDNYGILFEEGNVAELAKKLQSLIVDGFEKHSVFTPKEISEYAHEFLDTKKQASDIISCITHKK